MGDEKQAELTELDEALERFHLCDLEYGGGLANHGPMAVEALERLGHPALIPAFVEVYAPRLPELGSGVEIPAAGREAALGDPSRFADWVATFEAEIADEDWRSVLARAVELLRDGFFAGAAHGVLRTAHAVRGLSERDSPLRRRELAFGLAYWAGRHQRLPGEVGSKARPGTGPEEAMAAIDCVPESRRKGGLFFEAVRVLDAEPSFADAVSRVDPEAFNSAGCIGDLCRAAARLFLAHPGQRIAYVHVLTAPSALRLLEPALPPELRPRLRMAAFHTMAALHAVSGGEAPPDTEDAEAAALAESAQEIRYRAACSIEEHAIKMSEACLREDAASPDPVFRRAAADAALRIESGRSALC